MASREELVSIAHETLGFIKSGFYEHPNGSKVALDLENAVTSSLIFSPKDLTELETNKYRKTSASRIHVSHCGVLEASRSLIELFEPNIVCLNFASATRVCGGFLTGSKAQEEDLARASGLYPCLLKCEDYYNRNNDFGSSLYTDNMIYSPGVPVFRNEYGMLLPAPYKIAIITSPAPMARLIHEKEPDRAADLAPVMESRIRKILHLAAFQGHKTLVLGAWGCGAFANDPVVVADIFANYLNGEFHNVFDHVVFALYDYSGKHPNTKTFAAKFPEICDICVG